MSDPIGPAESGGILGNLQGGDEPQIMEPGVGTQGEAAGDFMKRQGMGDGQTWRQIVGPDHTQTSGSGPVSSLGEAAGDFMKRQGMNDGQTWMGIVGPDHSIVGPDHTQSAAGGTFSQGAASTIPNASQSSGGNSRGSGLRRIGVIALVLALLLAGAGGAVAMANAGVFGCQNNLHSASGSQRVAFMGAAANALCTSGDQMKSSGGANSSAAPTETLAPTATTAPAATTAPTATPHAAAPTVTPRTAAPTATPAPYVKFSVSPISYKQQCSGSSSQLPSQIITLDNSASNVSVAWSVSVISSAPLSGQWAQVTPSSGTVARGATAKLTITPVSTLCMQQSQASGGSTNPTTFTVTIKLTQGGSTYNVTDSVSPYVPG